MTKQEIVSGWLGGNLLTYKHEEASLADTWGSYRTFLPTDSAQNVTGLLQSYNFNLDHYANTDARHSPDDFVIEPIDPRFPVAGSGVYRNSHTPAHSCDRLIIYSGGQQGWWKIAAEQSAVIAQ